MFKCHVAFSIEIERIVYTILYLAKYSKEGRKEGRRSSFMHRPYSYVEISTA